MQDLMKVHLSEALLDLSATEPLAGITVARLTAYADVARRSFYNHFSDINDCIGYTASRPLLSGKNPFASVENFLDYLHQTMRHPEFYRQVVRLEGQNNYRQASIGWMRRNYRELFVERDLDDAERAYREALVDIFVMGATDFMFEWFAGDVQMTPEELMRVVFDSAPDFVRVRVNRTPSTLPDYPR